MQLQAQVGGPSTSSSASCCEALPRCFHGHPAKRLKLRSHNGVSRTGIDRARGVVCLAKHAQQIHAAAAVAERPSEAPAREVPVQLLTSSKSPELLRIRHSVS